MKTKAFIFFSLLICNLLPAQNIKLDITPHFLGVAGRFITSLHGCIGRDRKYGV